MENGRIRVPVDKWKIRSGAGAAGLLLTVLLLTGLQTGLLGMPAVVRVSAEPKQDEQIVRSGDNRRLILIVADLLKEEDLSSERLPHLRQWAHAGGIGLMNANAEKWSKQSAYLTIANSFPSSMPQIHSNAGFGLLGDVLRACRIDRTAIGSADSFLFVRDSSGAGSYLNGRVLSKQDPMFPAGRRFDPERALGEVGRWQANGSGLLVIEWEDLQQIASRQEELSIGQYNKLRQQALASLDTFAGRLLKQAEVEHAEASTMILWISPRTAMDQKNRELSPIVIAGGSIPPGSLLTSPTTRRVGIVSNLDVAATVLDFFRIQKPESMMGTVISGKRTAMNRTEHSQTDVNLQILDNLAAATKETYRLRPFVIILYGSMSLMILLLTAFMIWAGRQKWLTQSGEKSKTRVNRLAIVLGWGGTAVLAAPAAFLLLPVTGRSGAWAWWLGIGGITAGLTWGLMHIRSLLQRMLALSILLAGATVIDLVFGGHLLRQSVLSYDPIVGARYYGIGNEYMGLLVSWSLLGCGYLLAIRPDWRRKVKWLSAGLGTGIVLLLAHPDLGANAGGTITAAVAAAAVVALLSGVQQKTVGWISFAMAGFAAAILFWLNRSGESMTHISAVSDLIREGRLDSLLAIAGRKILMNLRLMNLVFGVWMVAGLLAAIVTAAFSGQVWIALFRKHRLDLQPFVQAGVLGVLAGFAFNDSGVVVASLMLLPILYTVLMILLAEAFPTARTTVPSDLSQLDRLDFSPANERGR